MLAGGRLRGAGETLEPARKEQGRLPVARDRGRLARSRRCAATPPRIGYGSKSTLPPSPSPASSTTAREPGRRFDGWLELVALLETERHPGHGPTVPRDQG